MPGVTFKKKTTPNLFLVLPIFKTCLWPWFNKQKTDLHLYLIPHSGVVFPELQIKLFHVTVFPLSRNIQTTVTSLESHIDRWTTLH